ncbi:MAG: nucleotidyltransferase domain-containing protein [Candidatus Methanoplasma sp.]|jgi:predicted nucleotidyltransferase|nr:nucleotidyltransferase domain-containing protein [Candidatus Methanoplasma sp.]
MHHEVGPAYSLEDIKRLITPVVSRYEVDRVYVFGPYARGDADGTSDVDLHIDADRLRTFDLCGLMVRLEEALGTLVDVIPTDSMSQDFLDIISREEILIYER